MRVLPLAMDYPAPLLAAKPGALDFALEQSVYLDCPSVPATCARQVSVAQPLLAGEPSPTAAARRSATAGLRTEARSSATFAAPKD